MPTRRATGHVATACAVATTALFAAPAASAHPTPRVSAPLTAHTVLSGAAHGWSSPDDLTQMGRNLYAAFQNGVPSTGGITDTPTQSTVVEFRLDGRIEHTWQLTGKCDGLTAEQAHHRLIATVNEDGNSSLYTINARRGGNVHRFTYDANPLPHGGGTDSITIDHGRIYVAASAPTNTGGPALYRVTLRRGVAHLRSTPFFDTSTATVANPPGGATTLKLTDPDSSTIVPHKASRFGGTFMLDAQGDQQAVFASHLDHHNQRLHVLNLSQAVDDTAFPTRPNGVLLAADASANSIVAISGPFIPGAAYTAVTPGDANNPPANPAPNYLGLIDLRTGTVTPVPTAGVPFQPHSLIYLRHG